jgi:hypothetical protein
MGLSAQVLGKLCIRVSQVLVLADQAPQFMNQRPVAGFLLMCGKLLHLDTGMG